MLIMHRSNKTLKMAEVTEPPPISIGQSEINSTNITQILNIEEETSLAEPSSWRCNTQRGAAPNPL
jgi:hypothetical protein